MKVYVIFGIRYPDNPIILMAFLSEDLAKINHKRIEEQDYWDSVYIEEVCLTV